MTTLWVITANTTETVKSNVDGHVVGQLHREIPTFLLSSNVQGILDEAGAKAIARRIINPTGDENLLVDITAVKWRDV
jgi:hypothetical protein